MENEENWLADAKKAARSEAEYIVNNLRSVADKNCVDPDWFISETLRYVRAYSKENLL